MTGTGAGLDSQWLAEDGRLRWRLAGRLDALAATAAREELAAADVSAPDVVVVDLRPLDFLDSAGLAVLVQLLRRCEAAGTPLRMGFPPAADAARVLELTQFDRIFVPADPADLP